MRLGVKVGPFYAGTSTRRRGRSSGSSVGTVLVLLLVLVVVFWPLYFGHEANGGYHAWVWAIAIPWWMLLTFLFLVLLLGSKSGKKK
jgi:succinate dehydrogenase hydrophobic anchor subunit